MEPSTQQQPELFDLAQVEGWGVLTRKEREFARAILEGCSQREAAKRAGYEGSEEVIDAAASRAVRSVKVQRLLSQAFDRAGASIELPLRQAAEILVRAMAEWRRGTSAETRAEARKEWEAAASYIASIHGKLKLRIEGQVHHLHQDIIPIPPESLPAIAQMRRDVIAETIAGGRS